MIFGGYQLNQTDTRCTIAAKELNWGVQTAWDLGVNWSLADRGNHKSIQRLWVIWGQCNPRVAAAPNLLNGLIMQLSPYFTRKPGISYVFSKGHNFHFKSLMYWNLIKYYSPWDFALQNAYLSPQTCIKHYDKILLKQKNVLYYNTLMWRKSAIKIKHEKMWRKRIN